MNPKHFQNTTLAVVVVALVTLVSQAHGRSVTIRKCCPTHQVIDVTRMKCRDSGGTQWSPRYYPDSDTTGNEDEEISYDIVTKIPKCPGGQGVHVLPLKDISQHSISASKFRLLKSGRLVGKHVSGNWIDIPANSCIDGIMNFEGPDDPSLFTGEEIDQAIITCPVLDETDSN